jgi:protein-disulfide isomerase
MKYKALAIMLTAPLLMHAEQRLIEGNAASAVRVVIYEDLQCGDCANFRKMMDEHLLPRFASKVAFEHYDFPLAKHNWARPAAVAARFFEKVKPELAVQFRREVLADLKQITAESLPKRIQQFAKANQVDAVQAIGALNDSALNKLVEEDYQDGVARGIAKTPTVLVNGEPFIERFTLEEISKAIEAAVKEARP